jgi:heterogeneous nuclear rnp K-like protein 2
LILRALVSTKDAGIVIGEAGKNVADLREQTGVKAGVGKVITGVHERVLTVSGSVEAVAKVRHALESISAFSIGSGLRSHHQSTRGLKSFLTCHYLFPSSSHTSIRLLVSHHLMGTIIGRNDLKISDGSGARMIASKLPQSTERIVDVQGSPESIGRVIEEIGKCLLGDWERGLGTVHFRGDVFKHSTRQFELWKSQRFLP